MIAYVINLIFYLIWIIKAKFNYPNYLLEKKYTREKIQNIPLSNPLVITIKKFMLENDLYKKGVIVSLSGGVDSMVVLAILLRLQKERYFKIGVVSINYNLRYESKDEMKFISDYLKPYIKYFKISNFKIGIVEGVSRKNDKNQKINNKRSEFEDKAKNIRFSSYKQMIDKYDYSGVMIGHHKDDLIENIFTNIMYGRDITDLTVFRKVSIKKEVKIFRPLMDHYKNEIYDLAHTFNIPYFLDTTPKWSKRGKMRNEIFPLLKNTFSDSYRNSLLQIGNMSDNIKNSINKSIEICFDPKVQVFKNGLKLNFSHKEKLFDKKIWKIGLSKFLHNLGFSMLTKKSIDRIFNNDFTKIKFLKLSKKFSLYYDDNAFYLIFNKLIVHLNDNYLKLNIQDFLDGNIFILNTYIKNNRFSLKDFNRMKLTGEIDSNYKLINSFIN